MSDEKEFPYVVARLWRPNDPVDWGNLCIYTYGCQVQYGPEISAHEFLAYVIRRQEADLANGWDKHSTYDRVTNPFKIYKIAFEEF